MKKLTIADVKKASKMSYGDGRGPTLKQYVEFINSNFKSKGYFASLQDWSDTPRRHLFGNVSHFGKTKYGKRLVVLTPSTATTFPKTIFTHNPLEPYRRNFEVARWIVDELSQKALKYVAT